MNDRIQALWEQARDYATTRHPVSNIVLSVNSEKFEGKFAELIVRECILKMDIVYAKALVDGIEGPDTFLNGVNVSIKAVNQHFGVEE